MCPARTELLLTSESKISKFETWKASFLLNRDYVMGTRTGHEMEDGEEREEREDGETGEDTQKGEEGEDGEEGGAKSSKCSALP
jgi:type II secretory pathway component HofQ